MRSLAEVAAYLQSDPLKYVVHLKMLAGYPGQIVWRAARVEDQTGLVLLLPAAANPFDAHTYPDARWIVLMAASGPLAAARLVQDIPRAEALVFKLVDDLTRQAVLSAFPARRKTAYHSFTSRAGDYPLDPVVVTASALDERLLPCFQSNGYTRPELELYFRQGSLSFSIFDGDWPLSTCLIFPNYERIWEIGGVYTAPAHRRQGLARKVVSAALRYLLAQGLIPRYQVVETNTASLALAADLGLERFVVTEHYFYPA